MRAQAIGDGEVVADAAAKAPHIGPAGGLLLWGSRVLRQCGAWRGKQDQDEDGAHWGCSTWRPFKVNCQSAF
jgi:hypothetical protein